MKKSKTPKEYKVIVDTREKKPWDFSSFSCCVGTKTAKLDTGDYSIVGLEDCVAIERKAYIGELSRNMFEPRFKDVLKRLSEVEFPFIICEFSLSKVFDYPKGSGIPENKWSRLKVTGEFLASCLLEIPVRYPRINLIFAGTAYHGKKAADHIFRRIVSRYSRRS